MMNLKKLLISFFLMMIGSIAIMGTVFAGVSISGSSNVYPGRSYTYTVKVTETASSIMGKASTGGVLGSQTKTWSKDSSSGLNQNLTATTKITVTIPSSATIGSTGSITVSGQGSSYDGGTVSKFSISGSKTIKVVASPTPEPPTAWELAIKEINKVEDNGSITIEMDPEDTKEINAPKEVFQAIKEKGVVMTVDYGTFQCVIDGKNVGTVADGLEDINLGLEMQPAERSDDMLVFTPNNTSTFIYAITYVLKPNLPLPEDMIYVYRYYTSNGVTEYVNGAASDENGNVLVYIFAPGKYVVSAASIDGTEGNMDIETFVELFATPTPEPTPEPTPTPTPSPTPEPVVQEPEATPIIWLLSGLLAVLFVGFIITLIMFKKKSSMS